MDNEIFSESSLDRTPHILFVDDEMPVLKSLKRFAKAKDWKSTMVLNAEEGLEKLAERPYDIVVSDMRMPGMDGAEFLCKVKEQWPETIRIILTGYSDISALEHAVNDAGIFNYVTKPWDDFMLAEVVDRAHRYRVNEQERVRLEKLTKIQNKTLRELTGDLEKKVNERTIEIEQALTLLQDLHERSTSKFLDSIRVLSQVLEWKEGQANRRGDFVSRFSERLAVAANCEKSELENIRLAASLHQLGILALPDSVREKPFFHLSDDDLALHRQVPIWGEMILSGTSGLEDVAKIVRHQSEWVNGKGYPDGLEGDAIPKASKILHVVNDFIDAYHGLLDEHISGLDGAISYIKSWSAKRYDLELVNQFIPLVEGFDDDGNSTVSVTLEELHDGMTLEKDILASNGMLLLSKGVCLTDKNIETLRVYRTSLDEDFDILVRSEER